MGSTSLITAAPAGALFRTRAESQPAARLFFHENNGFILGFVASLLGFVQWGVRAPLILPFLSLGLVLLVYVNTSAWLPLLIAGTLSLIWYRLYGLAALGAALIVTLLLSRFISDPFRRPVLPCGPRPLPAAGKKTILFLSGMNLILLQFFITREFSTLLAASELSVLIVATAYFVGYSVGYLIAPRFPERFVLPLGWVTLILHVYIFLFLKYFASIAIYVGAGWWALTGILFLTAFVTSSFYSLFLPRFTPFRDRDLKLVSTYSWELTGAIAGTAFLILSMLWFPRGIQPVYFAIFLLILWRLSIKSPARVFNALATVGLMAFLLVHGPPIARAVTRDYYAMREYSNPSLCYQAASMYHTIEILDTHPLPGLPPDGRWSFINGVLYFGYQADSSGKWIQETGLSEFTYYLAQLPAQYQVIQKKRRLKVLILGAGSMYSVGRVGPYAESTKLVEIDPDVVRSAEQCWRDFNQYDRWENTEIIIDDAKHFVRTDQRTYDLIVMDISAPYTLGMKILAGVMNEYPHTLVLNTGNRHGSHGFVYASLDSALDAGLMDSLLIAANQRSDTRLESNWQEDLDWSQIRPFSYTHMESLLSGNYWRLSGRLGLDRTLIDLDWMRRRWEKLDSLNLQFPQILREIFRSLWLWVWLGSLALAAGWSRYR